MADIELVIKISEEDYNFVKRQVADGITNPLKICIANGTPLPKQDKFDNQARWLLNGLKIQINSLADEKGSQLDLEDVMKIIDTDKEQKNE